MTSKVILITGASSGIGELLCQHYSRASFQVIGLSRTGQARSESNWTHLKCDVSSPENVKATISEITSKFGKLDILINNAATLKAGPLLLLSDQEIAAMIETNLFGTVLVSKYVLKNMISSRQGRIVNILSMAHKLNLKGDSVYAATKSAVETFSKVLNKEACRFGVTVNNIGISAMATGMLKRFVVADEESFRRIIPHERLATLESIVNTIDYFCDDLNLDVGGQSIYLGGV